uniref:Nebulette-like n=1 Tax=Scleropages formosus TaxID=113540 RepID=A0A8C9WSJ7_SCLFO
MGKGTAVRDTPEIERVRKNQENISTTFHLCSSLPQVKYKEQVGQPTAVGVTPEMERVRRNQENISTASVQGLHTMKGRGCSAVDTLELRRVRESQSAVSMVACSMV